MDEHEGWHPDDSFEHGWLVIMAVILGSSFIGFFGWLIFGLIKY